MNHVFNDGMLYLHDCGEQRHGLEESRGDKQRLLVVFVCQNTRPTVPPLAFDVQGNELCHFFKIRN
jgi:hypothetical protein